MVVKTINLEDKKILVTGAAGFIGSSLSYQLLGKCKSLTCLDNFNPYYDPKLKRKRKDRLDKKSFDLNFTDYNFVEIDLKDSKGVEDLIQKFKPDTICHLAAQAGVRYSLENPQTYVDNNISATLNILEASKNNGIKNIIFASTSSVYGLNEDMPFSESDSIDSTISTYATTKRACELLCHTYHNLYDINFRILRFFTVYGPWGRPDMALFLFTKAIMNNKSIDIFNNGKMERDFTYIDDIVRGFILSIKKELKFEIINLGCGNPVSLMNFIKILELKLDKVARKNMLPIQKGDVPATFADIDKAKTLLGYSPKVNAETGISNFVDWYKSYNDF